VENPLDEEERLGSLIADSILPKFVPNIELVTIEDKTLLIVEMFVSNQRPHWIKSEGPEGGVYVRLGSSNRQADAALVAELHRGAEGVSFDEMPMPELTLEDLDLSLVRESFSDKRLIDDRALRTLKLLTTYQGRLVPTKGAVLLLGKSRALYFPDAWIQCGRFVGSDKTVIFDHIDIHSTLPAAIEDIMLFLKKHAMRSADFSSVRRRDVWSIPLTILREAVINSLVHADYSQRGAPIRVSFFDDRIEIENPGILLPGMTLEDMKQGISRLRNHVIARLFRELNLIEQWGSGVRRIFNEAEEQGLPEPQIIEIGMRIRFTLLFSTAIPTQQIDENTVLSEERLESRLELRLESLLAAKVLLYLNIKDAGKSELASYLGHKSVSGELHKQIKRLLILEMIEMTLPGKPNSRLQKYRLTEKGRDLFQ